MKKGLILTIGNRDIQFDKDILSQFPEKFNEFFEPNNDDTTKLFITKSKEKSFYNASKQIFEQLDNIPLELINYPMLKISLEHYHKSFDKIILIASKQEPDPDDQDTYYVGKILEKILKSKLESEVILKTFSVSPISTYELINFFQQILEEFSDHLLVISNSGGTPAMRTASILASVSVNNVIDIIQVTARNGKINKENAQTFIHQIYQYTLKKMLDVYDYSGIINLPLKQEIKDIAQEALNEYNLTKDYFPKKKNQPKAPYDSRALKAIALLIENMRVTYIQGRYAEALQRIFRIEEAVWYLLFYLYLKENNFVDSDNPNKIKYEINGKSKRKPYEQLINFGGNSFGEFLKATFPDFIIEKKQEENNHRKNYFISFEKEEKPIGGKNFYYFLFKKLNIYSQIVDFFANLNKDEEGNSYTNKSKLNSLRNNSFLGHGLKGVTKEELLNVIGKSDFNGFIEELNNILLENISTYKFERLFDEINKRIKEEFNS